MTRADLSVGQRLAIGSLVIAVLIAILGGVIAVSVSRVAAARQEKIQAIAPRAKAADRLEILVYQEAVAFRNYALTEAPEELEAFDKSEQRVSQQMQALEALPKTPEGQSIFNDIPPRIMEHQRSFDAYLALASAGAGRDVLRKQEAIVSEQRDRVLEKVRAFAKVQAQRADEADREISHSMDALREMVAVLTFLILAASITTAWLVTRSVRDPAVKLSAAAEALGAGSFEPALALREKSGPGQRERFRDELREIGDVFGRTAARLKAKEERLAAYSRLSAVLGSSLDPHEVATQALREVTAHIKAEVGAVYLADETRSSLRAIATVALDGQLGELAIGAGIPGEAAAERQTIIVRDLPPETPFNVRLGFGSFTPRCVVASPMRLKDRIVGVIFIGAVHDLDADAVRFIDNSASQMAITLDNAVAHVRIAALADQLQEKNEELQAQNEELQAQGEELQVQGEELQVQNEELQAQSEELQVQSEDLRRQQESLARTNEALLAAEAQKNRFLAVLGHELRNPLAAIRAAVGLMGDGGADGDEVSSGAHAVIQRQTAHLGRLVDDLLDIARITTGKVVLERRPLNLGDAVQRAVSSLSTGANAAAAPHIDIHIHEQVWVDADETRMEQIVTNLVTNSVKYTPADGTISLRLSRDDSGAVLTVTDTGAGIPKELLPRMFDYFVQGTNGKGGLGVGLALVRNLVELHGGTVALTSDGPGRGTTVTVRLPALPGPPPKAARADAVPAAAKESIVIIEDNPDLRQMMQFILSRAGHTVTEAHDGPTGVAAVAAAVPDFALVDLDLPGFDGCEVARRIRRDPRLSAVRLVAVSGYGGPEDRARALDAGFDEHLVKPVEFERLQATLRKLHREASAVAEDEPAIASREPKKA